MVSGQLDAPAALFSGERTSALEPEWMLWRRENIPSLSVPVIEARSSSPYNSRYTVRATPARFWIEVTWKSSLCLTKSHAKMTRSGWRTAYLQGEHCVKMLGRQVVKMGLISGKPSVYM
jgi:hypothetical protein